jgi:hypothetical protein
MIQIMTFQWRFYLQIWLKLCNYESISSLIQIMTYFNRDFKRDFNYSAFFASYLIYSGFLEPKSALFYIALNLAPNFIYF